MLKERLLGKNHRFGNSLEARLHNISYGEIKKTHITQVSQNTKPIFSFSVVVCSDY